MGDALVLGIVAGGIYGLFALGIVLVYRGTGALNFAQGELGTAALYLAWWLVTDHGLGSVGQPNACTGCRWMTTVGDRLFAVRAVFFAV